MLKPDLAHDFDGHLVGDRGVDDALLEALQREHMERMSIEFGKVLKPPMKEID